jgi:beta propeller repeat protein
MKVCKKPFIWFLVAIFTFTLGFGLYSRWSHILKVSAVNNIRRVIPGGPVFWMAHEGDFVAGVGTAENDYNETALYLYDTKGTWVDLSDDSYTIIDQVEGNISHITFQNNFITWLDTTGFSSGSPMTLKAYNITTTTITIVSNQIADYIYGRDGDKVVYQYVVPNGRDIALYDLNTQQTTIICDAPSFQRNPHIKNNIILWLDSRNPQTSIDIYMYNLNTQTETLVAEDVGEYFILPVTNGTYVVYHEMKPDYTPEYIKKYHIPSQTTSIIASASQNERILNHSVHFNQSSSLNQHIVWVFHDRQDNTQSKLYLHHLDTATNTIIDQGSSVGKVTAFQINEQQVVYSTQDMQSVFGWDIQQQQSYIIRNTGKTYSYYLHPINNTMLMCSKGTGMDPNEWDISYASLP